MTGCGGNGGGGGADASPDAVVFPDARVGPDGGGECVSTDRYMTLVTGYSWTYRVTDSGSGTVESKTQTVGPFEDAGGPVAGTMAFRLTTVRGTGGAAMTISWQQDTGDVVLRVREQDLSGANHTDEYYTPARVRIDETPAHVMRGATWDETYVEHVDTNMTGTYVDTDKVEHWSIVATDDTVTVPGGTFCAMHIHRESTANGQPGSSKDYWFARGVGKIKEVGAGQTEELSAYTQ